MNSVPIALDQMSPQEKLGLIGDLWKSLEDESKHISDEHKKLLDESIDFHKKNPDSGRPWNDVKKDLLKP